MVVIGGVIHHGDGDGFTSGVGTVVSDPASAFSPSVLVGLAFGVGNVTFCDVSLMAEGWGDAEGEGTFLGVAESDVGDGSESRSDLNEQGVVAFLGEVVGADFF